MWLKIKQQGLRRFWSMFPLTRADFGTVFEPQPHQSGASSPGRSVERWWRSAPAAAASEASTAPQGRWLRSQTSPTPNGAVKMGRSAFVELLWMDKIHFAPPKKAWNDDSSVNTNKHWLQPWVSQVVRNGFCNHPQYYPSFLKGKPRGTRRILGWTRVHVS